MQRKYYKAKQFSNEHIGSHVHDALAIFQSHSLICTSIISYTGNNPLCLTRASWWQIRFARPDLFHDIISNCSNWWYRRLLCTIFFYIHIVHIVRIFAQRNTFLKLIYIKKPRQDIKLNFFDVNECLWNISVMCSFLFMKLLPAYSFFLVD